MSAQTSGRADGPSTMPSNESGWWEDERAKFIADQVDDILGPTALLADIGCGRGTLLRDGRFADGRTVVRVDSHLWRDWNERPGLYVCASADRLPFRDGSFDLVGSFDVLEHLPDDRESLDEQRRVTRRGGRVVAAVPADPRLWSAHDVAVGHQRRYDSSALTALGHRCGLRVVRLTSFFSFLWLPAWATRHRAARASEPGNSASIGDRCIRSAVGGFARGERWWLRRLPLPFGTSIWVEFEES